MKNLLYIGNNLSNDNKTPTTVETLGRLLVLEGFTVKTASSKSNKLLRLLDMLKAVILSKKKVDYVLIDTYSTTNFYYAYLVSQLCRVLRLKYIPILHGGNLQKRLKYSPKLSKALFKNAFKNVTPSEYLKSQFEDFDYHNLIVIPNTIELKNYIFKKRTFNKPKLLWVRSFAEIYNPLLAVEILKVLKEEHIEASLCMVGPEKDGSLKLAKQFAKELGVAVKFTGKLSKKEWITLSEDYNIFINTTNFDNMPVSVIEAMALGLQLVSTNVGGIPFLIKDKEEGILVEPNDARLLGDAIKNIILKTFDSKAMTLNARKKVEQFDWKIVKEKWISLLS
jgi:glycosyltransferase involved in cell wall biosynthesis